MSRKYSWNLTEEEIKKVRLEAAGWHHSHDVYKKQPSQKYHKGYGHGNPGRFFTNCDLTQYEPYCLAYEYNGAGKIFLSQFAYDTRGKQIESYWALFVHHTLVPDNDPDKLQELKRRMREGWNEFEHKYNWKLSERTWDRERYYEDVNCSTIIAINGPGIWVRAIK